jgi:NitT/TauT family transport system permease protein
VRIGVRHAAPLVLGIVVLGTWEAVVWVYNVPPFVLPAPSSIWMALLTNFSSLMVSLWTTLRITWIAFSLAHVSGVALAVLFSQSRLIEMTLFPYAVVLQVTPVVAIAPLILIWVGFEHIELALILIAWIVAFFPILSAMTTGLQSADSGLVDLLRLYGATRWQKIRLLQFPTALPWLLSSLKVSGGLALIGAVVAEFVAGSGTDTGLAWRIVEAGNRLEIAKMFAALALLSTVGILNFYVLSAIERALLRDWHESAMPRP